MWEAAQLWVVNNAGYKIQVATNVIIETFNSRDMNLAARVTKEPMGGGQYKFVAVVGCNNIFGCVKDPITATGEFNRQVRLAGIRRVNSQ